MVERKLSRRVYIYGPGLVLLLTGFLIFILVKLSIKSLAVPPCEDPSDEWDPKVAEAEITESIESTPDTISGLNCTENQRRTNDTIHRLCLVQDVQKTWPFTHPMCGLRNQFKDQVNEGQGRIFENAASQVAVTGEYPWYILILGYAENYIYSTVSCGGSMITPTRGLTAAHCCVEIYRFGIDRFLLHFGPFQDSNQIYRNEHNRDQFRTVKECIGHPDYNGTAQDVGILKWDLPVEIKFSSTTAGLITVNTVCLPPEPFYDWHILDTWQEIAGAGRFSERTGASSPGLRRALLYIDEENEEVCLEDIQKQYPNRDWVGQADLFYIHCRVPHNRAVLCEGDSGSGMLRVGLPQEPCRSDKMLSLRAYQVGVYSVMFGTNICGQQYGSGFVNVSAFREFILENVE